LVGMEKDTEYTLESVPITARLSLIAVTLVWASLTLDPSAPYLAMWWGSSYTFATLLIAILSANILLSIFSSLSGYIGAKYGLSYGLATRIVFGEKGSFIPAIWAGFVCIGWLAFSIGVTVDTITSFIGFPEIYYIFVIIFTLIFSVTAYLGIKHITKLAYIGVPLLVILIILGVTLSISRYGIPSLGSIDFSQYPLLLSLILGTFVNGSIVLSFDYQRFSKDPRSSVIIAFANFLGFWTFIIVLSAIPAAIIRQDLISTYTTLGLMPIAIITLFLLAWTSADNQLYSASLSWTAAINSITGKIVNRRSIVIIASILTIVLSLIKLHIFAVSWLSLMTTIALPAGIIIWADHFIVSKITRTNWGTYRETINIDAFIAWIIGSLTIYYLVYIISAWYGLLLSFITIIATYTVIKILRLKR